VSEIDPLDPGKLGPAALLVGWSRCRQGLAEHVFASQKLSPTNPTDPLPILAEAALRPPVLGILARDDRPWKRVDPPAAVYFYSPIVGANVPPSSGRTSKGVLQVDGYPGFERLATAAISSWRRWSHTGESSMRVATSDQLTDRRRGLRLTRTLCNRDSIRARRLPHGRA